MDTSQGSSQVFPYCIKCSFKIYFKNGPSSPSVIQQINTAKFKSFILSIATIQASFSLFPKMKNAMLISYCFHDSNTIAFLSAAVYHRFSSKLFISISYTFTLSFSVLYSAHSKFFLLIKIYQRAVIAARDFRPTYEPARRYSVLATSSMRDRSLERSLSQMGMERRARKFQSSSSSEMLCLMFW